MVKMAKGIIFKIKDERWFCPVCNHNKIIGKAAQCCEDGCEMWFECENCGYDPTGICDKVETVMGWDDEMQVYALEVYRDCHPAGKAIIRKHIENNPTIQ